LVTVLLSRDRGKNNGRRDDFPQSAKKDTPYVSRQRIYQRYNQRRTKGGSARQNDVQKGARTRICRNILLGKSDLAGVE